MTSGGPTWRKFVHVPPAQRSTWYPATPTSSVDAPQPRLIWLLLAAVAVSVAGAVGACVSGDGVPPTGAILSPRIPASPSAPVETRTSSVRGPGERRVGE